MGWEYADKASMQNPSGGGTTESIADYEELANLLNERMLGRKGGQNQRLAIMLGMLTKDKNHPLQAPFYYFVFCFFIKAKFTK